VTFYLTQDELREFTGRERAGAQIRWLTARGFRPHRRADGLVLLKREDYEDHKDGKKGKRQGNTGLPESEPDFTALTD
jgi:hypothetical protein